MSTTLQRKKQGRHHSIREGGPVKEGGVPSSAETLSVQHQPRGLPQVITTRAEPTIKIQPIVEAGDLATAILMSKITSLVCAVKEVHAGCLRSWRGGRSQEEIHSFAFDTPWPKARGSGADSSAI